MEGFDSSKLLMSYQALSHEAVLLELEAAHMRDLGGMGTVHFVAPSLLPHLDRKTRVP